MFYRHPFRKRNALEGKKGPAFFENAIFLRFVKRRNELRLIPCQGEKKKKTNKEEKQTFVPVAQLTGKNLERKGFETGEKRSPNVIGSPRPLSLSLSLSCIFYRRAVHSTAGSAVSGGRARVLKRVRDSFDSYLPKCDATLLGL